MGILHNRCILFVLGIGHKTPFNTSEGPYLLRLTEGTRWEVNDTTREDVTYSKALLIEQMSDTQLKTIKKGNKQKSPPKIPLYAVIGS